MIPYSEFQPTALDPIGWHLDDRQHWLLAPVCRTRDSSLLSYSNFEIALAMLGGESETVEVHRFDHWGLGWFEIILIDPGDVDRVTRALAIECALEDDLILDEEDYATREELAAT